MHLARLRLSNFRNLVDVDLDVPAGVSIYFGENAQGKTTIVEAVYILAIARSFRAENDRELVNFDAAQRNELAFVEGLLEQMETPHLATSEEYAPPESPRERRRIIVGYQPAQTAGAPGYRVSRDIRVDRSRRTAAELVGQLHAVLFSALDIDLVQGPPTARRRFLDILISQADSTYLRSLQRYQQVLRQRNRLLRLRREGRANPDELAFWNDELIKEGAWVTRRRYEVLQVLSPAFIRHHRELGGEGEAMDLRYSPNIPLQNGDGGLTDRYRAALQSVAAREAATAITAAGPHRDDIEITLNGVNARAFSSRGQARTIALALRLAEAETMSALRGDEPLLLLDDALSEMDARRRQRVLEKTSGYPQVMITTTEPEQVTGFFGGDAHYFHISGGVVVPHGRIPP